MSAVRTQCMSGDLSLGALGWGLCRREHYVKGDSMLSSMLCRVERGINTNSLNLGYKQ
jgi:hypothetical protein